MSRQPLIAACAAHRERITFNHSVSRSVILGPDGPGDAAVELETIQEHEGPY
ncbi:hypothetical protein [Gimesia maris]|uniref:hypothetical protein n=1 Tax=Gimesia maris TaxID=122 RepID=UPI0030DAB0F3